MPNLIRYDFKNNSTEFEVPDACNDCRLSENDPVGLPLSHLAD